MKTCPNCGRTNPDDRDFCVCGEYLKWDEGPPPAGAPATPAGGPGASTPSDNQPAAVPSGGDVTPAGASTDSDAPSAGASTDSDAPSASASTDSDAPSAGAPTDGPPTSNSGGSGDEPPSTNPPAPPAPDDDDENQPPSKPAQHEEVSDAERAGLIAAASAAGVIDSAVDAAIAQGHYGPVGVSDSAMVSIRLPDATTDPDTTIKLPATPGERTRVLVSVRNESTIVDNFSLSVRGIPEDWYTFAPGTVYLLPIGNQGTTQQEVELFFHPPKAPEATAKVWDIQVVATSRTTQSQAGYAPLDLDIQPYVDFNSAVAPRSVAGYRKGTYSVGVTNDGNAPVALAFSAQDQDGQLGYSFSVAGVQLEIGEYAQLTMVVRPLIHNWYGRPIARRFEVTPQEAEVVADASATAGATAADTSDQPTTKLDASKTKASGAEGEAKDAKSKAGKVEHKIGHGISKLEKEAGASPGKASGDGIKVGPHGLGIRKPQLVKPEMSGKQLNAPNISSLSDLAPPSWLKHNQVEIPNLPSQAIFRQRPIIAWWVPFLILALLVAAIIVYLFLPRHVAVPNVIGDRNISEAEHALNRHDLELNPRLLYVTASKDYPPGSIVAQSPSKGKKANPGDEITLTVAKKAPAAENRIPNLTGLTTTKADNLLNKYGFNLGSITPSPSTTLPIASQLPAPGVQRPAGTSVTVILGKKATPKTPKKPNNNNGKNNNGGNNSSNGSGSNKVVKVAVPKIKSGAGLASTEKALRKAGFAYSTVRKISSVGIGEVTSVSPAGGAQAAKGSTVKIYVSAGIPKLLFDNGATVFAWSLLSSMPVSQFSSGNGMFAHNGTWMPDGYNFLYVNGPNAAGGAIFRGSILDDRPRQLTDGSTLYTSLSASGFSATPVVAMLELGSDNNAVCFAAVHQLHREAPKCLPKSDSFIPSGEISWSPNGTQLLVAAHSIRNPKQFGIVRYKSEKQFSINPADWSRGSFITPMVAGLGVVSAVISPDGKKLAVATNLPLNPNAPDQMQLYLTSAGDWSLEKAKLVGKGVQACTIAWRTDSEQIAVGQGAADCSTTGAEIVRINVSNSKPVDVAVGQNPQYQPIVRPAIPIIPVKPTKRSSSPAFAGSVRHAHIAREVQVCDAQCLFEMSNDTFNQLLLSKKTLLRLLG